MHRPFLGFATLDIYSSVKLFMRDNVLWGIKYIMKVQNFIRPCTTIVYVIHRPLIHECLVLPCLPLFTGNTWSCHGNSIVWGEWMGWPSARSWTPYKCHCCCSWPWTCPRQHFLLSLQGTMASSTGLYLLEHIIEARFGLLCCGSAAAPTPSKWHKLYSLIGVSLAVQQS